jgi:hypothetical protein
MMIKWKTKYTTSSEQFNNLKIIEVKRWIPLTQIYMTTDSSLASAISIKMDWSYTSCMDCPIVPFLWNDAAIARRLFMTKDYVDIQKRQSPIQDDLPMKYDISREATSL